MARDSFIFYREYKEALDSLKDDKKKLQFYECITTYTFYNTIPNNVDKEIIAMFTVIKKELDRKNKSYLSYEIRRSNEYKKWKNTVLRRDSYTCQKCGSKNNLVVHHVKSFSEYPELRLEVSNGLTLCQNCHKEEHIQ